MFLHRLVEGFGVSIAGSVAIAGFDGHVAHLHDAVHRRNVLRADLNALEAAGAVPNAAFDFVEFF